MHSSAPSCQNCQGAIFKWDKVDIEELRDAKKREMRRATNRIPIESQVTDSITTSELAKHCRRLTRGAEESRNADPSCSGCDVGT